MENPLIINIPSSFVKRRIKLAHEKGNGESKLYLGKEADVDELDEFFNNFNPNNTFEFHKEDILRYLDKLEIEFVGQRINRYKDVNIEFYRESRKEIENWSTPISFKIEKFVDKNRYYIRAKSKDKDSEEVFNKIIRMIALPKITDLIITKQGKSSFSFKFELNHKYILGNVSDFDEEEFSDFIEESHQRIFFGAPGTGKSYELNEQANKYFSRENYDRVTFHPNYMYGNFIGSFKPFSRKDGDDQKISYEYIPGVLLRLLIKAYENPEDNYLLIIEEINRANVAAVFGDFFQLLDRDENGNSEYEISTSEELREYLSINLDDSKLSEYTKHRIQEDLGQLYLPKNMYIWATMNSADQGVMPMDTAFRRRWDFEYLGINEAVNDSFTEYKMKISSNEITTWDNFRREVNRILSSKNIPEDKLLGPYFIPKKSLEKDINTLTDIIKNKVLMYIFEDAGKAYKNQIFDFKNGELSTFSTVLNKFEHNVKQVFKDELRFETEPLIQSNYSSGIDSTVDEEDGINPEEDE